jgi:hypothetical protein
MHSAGAPQQFNKWINTDARESALTARLAMTSTPLPTGRPSLCIAGAGYPKRLATEGGAPWNKRPQPGRNLNPSEYSSRIWKTG